MSGLIFSLPYQLLVVLYLVLVVLERVYRTSPSRQACIRFGCIALYLLFIGLRGYIGTDWYNYRLIFDAVPPLFSSGWSGYFSGNLLEPGFVAFVSLVKSIWNNYHFLLFVSACLDLIVLNAFLKRYVDGYALGFLVFLVMGGLTLCDLLRNVRSILLFLLSLRYLSQRRALPYFALNLLGMCFHISSIVYLPLYWILHRRWPKAVFITVFVVGNLLFWLRIEWVRPVVEQVAELLGGRFAYLQAQYLLNDLFDEPYRLSIGYLERILTSLLILGFYHKLHRQRGTNVLFINSYVLYFAFFFFFAEIREFAARFSLLFIFSYWVLFPAVYETLRVRFNRRVYLAVLFVYCWLKITGMTGNVLYRYDNVLWGIESYDKRTDAFHGYYRNR